MRITGKQARRGLLAGVAAAVWLAGAPMMAAPAHAEGAQTSAQATTAAQSGTAAESRLSEVLQILSQEHVSGTGEDALSDAGIRGMVDSLHDKYTVYMSDDEYKQFTDSLEQHYVGIGIRFEVEDGAFFVADTYPGSPAEAAGLQAGDQLVAIDGVELPTNGDPEELTKRVLGPESSSVQLTLQRDGEQLTKTVTRRSIDIPVVESKRLDAAGIGYIRVSTFSSQADEQFADQLSKLGKLHALILDLRDNPGGLLDTAAGIAKHFIPSGTLIHTKDRDGNDHPVTLSGGTKVDYPVYVLVNENSASASEVLTGALQDGKIATVIGTTTYGKGSVQQLFPLSAGGLLKVTIEHYFTPNGHPVNGVGITPDIRAEGGDVPQLLMALRCAGLIHPEVVRTIGSTTVNGVRFADSFAVLHAGGRLLVPTRVVAAVLGADVGWEQEKQAVKLTLGAASVSLYADQGDFILDDGTSYVDPDRIRSAFPQFVWEQTANGLTMTTQAAGRN